MLTKLTRLFPLWAVLLSVAAYYSPSTFLGIGLWVTYLLAHAGTFLHYLVRQRHCV